MNVVTRGDLDGLACTVFIGLMEDVDKIRFSHPKDMQDGKVPITEDDVIVNLPYVPGAGMWFDHHSSQEQMIDVAGDFKGRYEVAPSAARVIYEYYDSPKLKPYDEMLVEVDRVDSADLNMEDVTDPEGWVLLPHTCDPRSGLARFQDYFTLLVDLITKQTPIEEIMEHPEVKSRTEKLLGDQEDFAKPQMELSHLDGNVIVTDLRGKRDLPSGNRFLIYTLLPGRQRSGPHIRGHKQQHGRRRGAQHLQPDLQDERRRVFERIWRRRSPRGGNGAVRCGRRRGKGQRGNRQAQGGRIGATPRARR